MAKKRTMRGLGLALAVGETKSGDWLVADTDGLQLVKRGTDQVTAQLEQGMEWVGLSPDGTLLAYAFADVHLLELPSLAERWRVKTDFEEARALFFERDAVWHSTRTGSERLALKNGKQLEKTGQAARVLATSPDAKWRLMRSKTPGMSRVGPPKKQGVEFPGDLAAFLPDGTLLSVDGGSGSLKLWRINATNGAVVKAATGPNIGSRPLERLCVSPTGHRAVVTTEKGFAVIEVDALTAKEHAFKSAQCAAFARDDETLLMATTKFQTKRIPRP